MNMMLFCTFLCINLILSVNLKILLLDSERKTTYMAKSSCPDGYKLANLTDPKDWDNAVKLATDTLGPDQSVWIRSGLGWRGLGNEHWTLITAKPKGSCPFPPKSIKEFCVPFDRPRLSPRWDGHTTMLQSVCEKIQ